VTATCQKRGCEHKGEWAIELHVPAKGWPLDSHKPLTVMCGIPLCRDHAHQDDAGDFFFDANRAVIADMIKSMGFVEPDFDRAWSTPIRRTDPRFIAFQQQVSDAGGPTIEDGAA
jgi:hypothetical protein